MKQSVDVFLLRAAAANVALFFDFSDLVRVAKPECEFSTVIQDSDT
jgi:hypothetical protein